jgi:Ca2+:H+ antiporter
MLRTLAASPMNALLAAAPVSWALAAAAYDSPWVFMAAAVSLVPLAGLIGLGTEQLACR